MVCKLFFWLCKNKVLTASFSICFALLHRFIHVSVCAKSAAVRPFVITIDVSSWQKLHGIRLFTVLLHFLKISLTNHE
jgi:hypothetical protein